MAEIIGLTNAMTDIVIQITDKQITDWGMKKGFHNHGKVSELSDVLESMEKIIVTGGGSANTIRDVAALGLSTGLMGTVGDDIYGQNYISELQRAGIENYMKIEVGNSPICYVLVTPDKEKTSTANMGVGAVHDYNLRQIITPKIFHTTGYEVEVNPLRVLNAMHHFHRRGTLISLDLADPNIIKTKRKEIDKALSFSDIVFMTTYEAEALKGNAYNALKDYSRHFYSVVLKRGSDGCAVIQNNKVVDVPSQKVAVVNTNGAGDAFAGGFLYGLLNNYNIVESAKNGNEVAAKVVSRLESHL